MSPTKADKDEPVVELKGEEAKKALQQQQNPLAVISQVINNHATKFNEIITALDSSVLDIKTNKANMEIFDKRFGLIERQLDNIEKELSRIKEMIK